jgi:hypothetical protein
MGARPQIERCSRIRQKATPTKGGPLRETPDEQSDARRRHLGQNSAVFGCFFATIRMVGRLEKLLLGGLELSGDVPI